MGNLWETLEILNKIGPFLSGVSLLLAACAAWVTVFKINRRAMYMTWLDGFRALYAEFWQNRNIARVRSWISSDVEYAELEKILLERLKSKRNLLNAEANKTLEQIDQFCALLVRIEFFDRTIMTRQQRDLWQRTYGDFWGKKINEREALRQYMEEYWPGVGTRTFLQQRR